jgi:hypothetical protein
LINEDVQMAGNANVNGSMAVYVVTGVPRSDRQ